MNFNDISSALDISYTTLKYYESCGLIEPHEGSYLGRHFSEDEFHEIERITLLRTLGFSVHEILSIKRGEVSLRDKLIEHVEAIMADPDSITQAAIVCQNIRHECVEYSELKAGPHIMHVRELKARGGVFFETENTASSAEQHSTFSRESKVKPENNANTCPHPWRRYFARSFDLALYILIADTFFGFLVGINATANIYTNFIWLVLVYCLMFLIEPILLSTIGTTPGKFFMGITIRNAIGKKLTLKEAYTRSFLLWRFGFGFSVPVYNIYREIKCYLSCQKGEVLEWDRECNIKAEVIRPARIVLIILAMVLVNRLDVLLTYQAAIPSNRGDITVEEFYENCYEVMRYNNMPATSLPDYRLTETNGYVTEVIFEVNADGQSRIYSFDDELYIATMAFAATQSSFGGLSIYFSDLPDLE